MSLVYLILNVRDYICGKSFNSFPEFCEQMDGTLSSHQMIIYSEINSYGFEWHCEKNTICDAPVLTVFLDDCFHKSNIQICPRLLHTEPQNRCTHEMTGTHELVRGTNSPSECASQKVCISEAILSGVALINKYRAMKKKCLLIRANCIRKTVNHWVYFMQVRAFPHQKKMQLLQHIT